MEARSPIFCDVNEQPYGKTDDDFFYLYVSQKKPEEKKAGPVKKYQLVNGRACLPGTEKRVFFIPTNNPKTKNKQIEYSCLISKTDIKDTGGFDLTLFSAVNVENSLESPFSKPQKIALEILREVILVVGAEQHAKKKGMKLVFLAQAVREVRENNNAWKNCLVTMVLFVHGYTPEELQVATDAARSFNPKTRIRRIDSTDKLINYINTGDVNNKKERFAVINVIKVFSHGYPSKITFNLDGANQQQNELRIEHITKLQKNAFSTGAEFYSYACRSGSTSGAEVIDAAKWRETVKPENSLAQKIADHLNITVFGFVTRTSYTPTWNDGGDLVYRKKFVDLKDKSVDITLWNPKTWDDYDEALWNPDGAKNKPVGGDTPVGPPNTMFTFESGTSPY